MSKPAFERVINNKPLWVFDDLCNLDEIKDIYTIAQTSPYSRSESARPDTSEHKHFVLNFNAQQITLLPVYSRIIQRVMQVTNQQYSAYRGYINHANFGDVLFTHTDCLPEQNELTALVYVSDEWNIEWGGETLFFDENDDCAFACTPKPGRVVVFHGAIKHVGRPPTRLCYKPRYTLAYKFAPAEA
jgi:Rps23 Pro-64 3,4-dihydroxylase Tpa1-like proline 4-hydroxylase